MKHICIFKPKKPIIRSQAGNSSTLLLLICISCRTKCGISATKGHNLMLVNHLAAAPDMKSALLSHGNSKSVIPRDTSNLIRGLMISSISTKTISFPPVWIFNPICPIRQMLNQSIWRSIICLAIGILSFLSGMVIFKYCWSNQWRQFCPQWIPVWLDKWDKKIRKNKYWHFCSFIWNELPFVALASYKILY